MKRVLPSILPVVILTLSGCMTRLGSMPEEHAMQVESVDIPVETLAATDPGVSAQPAAGVQQPKPLPSINTPAPIWKNPEIISVETEAFLNEKGELVEPGRKHVIRRQGGWNLDAMRNPTAAYIPPENLPTVPSAAPYTAYVAPGTGLAQTDPASGSSPALVKAVGAENIRLTGFFREEDRGRAAAMAKEGEVLVFDPNLGFILVPQSIFMETPVAMPTR